MSTQTIATSERLITGEELLLMPDLGPCELVRGRMVAMSPTGNRHGDVECRFARAIAGHVVATRSGKVMVGEVGIFTRRAPDSVRGADVAYISNERYARQPDGGYLQVAPDLVVEILSPNDPWSAVMEKLHEYFGIGVRLVWIADPVSRTVYAYRSPVDVRELGPGDQLPGDDVLPGFSVGVSELFED